MDKIEHRIVSVNALNMHVAEIGEGPAVLLLHGFPELWYSWRHQMVYLAAHGYRAIAPDLRGFGDTDAPQSTANYSALHIVGDLVGLLDLLGLDQVFLVGHDWGAVMGWYFCLFRPDRIKALVNLSVAFRPRDPSMKPIQGMQTRLGEDFYICRFQEAKAEVEFARYGAAAIMRRFLTGRNSNPPRIREGPDGSWFGSPPDAPIPLPDWISEEDINYYATKFDQKGFTGGLNYYRVMDLNWELMAPWTGARIKTPVKFVVGDLDPTYNFPGVKEYVQNGGLKRDVPGLEEVVVLEGVAHFLNQEVPQEINKHIYDFIQKF